MIICKLAVNKIQVRIIFYGALGLDLNKLVAQSEILLFYLSREVLGQKA